MGYCIWIVDHGVVLLTVGYFSALWLVLIASVLAQPERRGNVRQQNKKGNICKMTSRETLS